VSRERYATEVADVLEAVEAVPVEAPGRVPVEAHAEDVPGGCGELRAHQDENPVAVALERLRVEVVVIGDPRKARPVLAAARITSSGVPPPSESVVCTWTTPLARA